MKANVLLLTCIALLAACASPEPDLPDPPDPIGDDLLRVSHAIGLPECTVGHMYRNHERVQYQCFSSDGIEAALAVADPTNTTPTNIEGSCTDLESHIAGITLWVGSRSVTYPVGCPPEGLLQLHDAVLTLSDDMFDCMEYELDMLESLDPGRRPY